MIKVINPWIKILGGEENFNAALKAQIKQEAAKKQMQLDAMKQKVVSSSTNYEATSASLPPITNYENKLVSLNNRLSSLSGIEDVLDKHPMVDALWFANANGATKEFELPPEFLPVIRQEIEKDWNNPIPELALVQNYNLWNYLYDAQASEYIVIPDAGHPPAIKTWITHNDKDYFIIGEYIWTKYFGLILYEKSSFSTVKKFVKLVNASSLTNLSGNYPDIIASKFFSYSFGAVAN